MLNTCCSVPAKGVLVLALSRGIEPYPKCAKPLIWSNSSPSYPRSNKFNGVSYWVFFPILLLAWLKSSSEGCSESKKEERGSVELVGTN